MICKQHRNLDNNKSKPRKRNRRPLSMSAFLRPPPPSEADIIAGSSLKALCACVRMSDDEVDWRPMMSSTFGRPLLAPFIDYDELPVKCIIHAFADLSPAAVGRQIQFSCGSSFMSRLLLVAALDEVHEERAPLHLAVPGKGDEARLEVDRADALLAHPFIREEDIWKLGLVGSLRRLLEVSWFAEQISQLLDDRPNQDRLILMNTPLERVVKERTVAINAQAEVALFDPVMLASRGVRRDSRVVFPRVRLFGLGLLDQNLELSLLPLNPAGDESADVLRSSVHPSVGFALEEKRDEFLRCPLF